MAKQINIQNLQMDLIQTANEAAKKIIQEMEADQSKRLEQARLNLSNEKQGTARYNKLEAEYNDLSKRLSDISIKTRAEMQSKQQIWKNALNSGNISVSHLEEITKEINQLAKTAGVDTFKQNNVKGIQTQISAINSLATALGNYQETVYKQRPNLTSTYNTQQEVNQALSKLNKAISSGNKVKQSIKIDKNNKTGQFISPLEKLPTTDIKDMVFYDLETIGEIGSDNIVPTQISMLAGNSKDIANAKNAFIRLSKKRKDKLMEQLNSVSKGGVISEDVQRELLSFANIIKNANNELQVIEKHKFSGTFKLSSRDTEVIQDIKKGLSLFASTDSSIKNLYGSTSEAWNSLKKQIGANGNTKYVGHNTIGFDNLVLTQNGVSAPGNNRDSLDTVSLARQFLKLGQQRQTNTGENKILTGLSLDELADFFGVTINEKQRHSAGYDTFLNKEIYEAMSKFITDQKLKSNVKKLNQNDIGIAQKTGWRRTADSYKLLGGNALDTSNFKDLLFKLGDAYQFNGLVKDGNASGGYSAKFTSMSSGDIVVIAGSLQEIQGVINQVFGDNFAKDFNPTQIAQNLISNMFKAGNKGYFNAKRIVDSDVNGDSDLSKTKKFLIDNGMYQFLEEMVQQIDNAISNGKINRNQANVVWQMLGGKAGISQNQLVNATTYNNTIIDGVKKNLTSLMQAYKDAIQNSGLDNSIQKELLSKLDLAASVNKYSETQISEGQNPFYNIGSAIFQLLSDSGSQIITDLKAKNTGNIQELSKLQNNPFTWVSTALNDSIKQLNTFNTNNIAKEIGQISQAKMDSFTGKYTIPKLMTYNYDKETAKELGGFTDKGGQYSLENILKEIVQVANSKGLGIEFGINSSTGDLELGFYNAANYNSVYKDGKFLWDNKKVAGISLGLANENGVINVGSQAKTNMYSLRMNKAGDTYLVSSMEQQAINILNSLKFQGDNNRKSIAQMLQESGEAGEAQKVLKQAVRRAFELSATASSAKTLGEDVTEVANAGSSIEQQLARSSTIQFDDFFTDLWKRAQKEGQISYTEELTESIRKYLIQLFAYYNNKFNGSNDVVKMSEGMKNLDIIPMIHDTLVKLAPKLMINYQGTKEEQTYDGRMLRQLSSANLEAFGQFKEESDRSTDQGYNKVTQLIETTARTAFKQSNFASLAGNENRETLRVGHINDNILLEIWQKVEKKLRDKNLGYIADKLGPAPSVAEGGAVFLQGVLKGMEGYTSKNKAGLVQGEYNEDYVRALGIKKGEEITHELSAGESIFLGKKNGKELWAHEGDIVTTSLNELGDEVTYQIRQLVKGRQGTKVVGGGFRNTVNTTLDDYNSYVQQEFANVLKEYNYENVQVLVEDRELKSKNFSDVLRQRLEYIFNEYIAQQQKLTTGKSVGEIREDISKKIKSIKEIPDAFKKFFNIDSTTGQFAFNFANNKDFQSLLHDEQGNTNKQFLALFDKGSYVDLIGKALHGINWDKIASSKMADVSMSLANNEYWFMDSIGAAHPEERESKHRVKLGYKEQDALQRGIGLMAMSDEFASEDDRQEVINAMQIMIENLKKRQSQRREELQKQIKAEAELARMTIDGSKELNEMAKNSNLVTAYSNTTSDSEMQKAVDQLYRTIGEWQGGGVSELEYDKTPLGMIEKFFKGQRAFIDLGTEQNGGFKITRDGWNKVLQYLTIPNITKDQAQIAENQFGISEINNALSNLFKSILDARTQEREIGNITVQKAVNSYLEALNKFYTTGENFASLSEITPPNATVGQSTGMNRAFTAQQGNEWLENIVLVSKEQMSEMLRATGLEENNSKNERNRVAQLNQLRALVKYLDDTYKTIDSNLIKELDGSTWEAEKAQYGKFQETETKIINAIIKAITYKKGMQEDEASFLNTFMHRYPSINGLDEIVSGVMVDSSLTNGSMKIGSGLADMLKADFDGDKLRTWLGLYSSTGETFDEAIFNNTERGKNILKKVFDDVAKDIASLRKKEDKVKFANPFGDGEEAELKLENLRATIQNSKLMGYMAKFSKENIGGLSNVSSMWRGMLYEGGLDERGLVKGDESTLENAAKSILVRAIFEQFEQDSISSKKISGRLVEFARNKLGASATDEDINKLIMDEINLLTKDLQSNNFKNAISTGTKLGIFEGGKLETTRAQASFNLIKRVFGEVGEKVLRDFGVSQDEKGRYTSMDVQENGERLILSLETLLRQRNIDPQYGKYSAQYNYNSATKSLDSANYTKLLDLLHQGLNRPKYGEDRNSIIFTRQLLNDIQALRASEKTGDSKITEELRARIKEVITNGDQKEVIQLAQGVFGTTITSEAEAVEKLNKLLGIDHVKAVQDAINAEKGKIQISENLQNTLGGETSAFKDATQAAEEEAKKRKELQAQGALTFEQFSKGRGSYSVRALNTGVNSNGQIIDNANGGEVLKSVSSYYRDLTNIGGFSKWQSDIDSFLKIATNVWQNQGRNVTLEDFAGNSAIRNQSDFNKIRQDAISASNGNIMHKVNEILAQYQNSHNLTNDQMLQDIDKLVNVLHNDNDFRKVWNDELQKLNGLGYTEDEFNLVEKLRNTFESLKSMGLTLSPLVEKTYGLAFKDASGKEVKIGGRGDAIYLDSNGNARAGEIKTTQNLGQVGIFENSLFALFTQLNEKFRTINGKTAQFSNDLDSVIVQILDNMAQVVPTKNLSVQSLGDLLFYNKEIANGRGIHLNEEERNAIFGFPDLVGAGSSARGNGIKLQSEFATKYDKNAIKEYFTNLREVVKLEQEISLIDNKLAKPKPTDDVSFLEKRRKNIEELLNSYRDLKALQIESANGTIKIGGVELTQAGLQLYNEQSNLFDKKSIINSVNIQSEIKQENIDRQINYVKIYEQVLKDLGKAQQDLAESTKILNNAYASNNKDLIVAAEKLYNQYWDKVYELGKQKLNFENTVNYDKDTIAINGTEEKLLSESFSRIAQARENYNQVSLQSDYNLTKQRIQIQETLTNNIVKLAQERAKKVKEVETLINQQKSLNVNNEKDKESFDLLAEKIKILRKEISDLGRERNKLTGLGAKRFGLDLTGNTSLQGIRAQSNIDVNNLRQQRKNIPSSNTATTSQINAQIREYINLLKQQQKTEQDIYRTNVQAKTAKGEDLNRVKAYNLLLQQRQQDLQRMTPSYNEQVQHLKEMGATEEQIANFEQKRNEQLTQGSLQMAKLQATYKAQVPLVDKIFNSFKQALSYMSLTSIISRSIWKIQNMFRTIVQYAKELNSSMVNIQIAASMGLPEARENMIQLNKLAKELGMTTTEMASAQNDWLRAGYRGEEVMDLTKASATLATLGMIQTSDATSYLISTLKGWKLGANEVMDVVSKLTAVDSAAAISAGDLAEAMSRANNSAANAGIEMNRYIGLLTVGADVTQRAPESVGQAWNTLIARMGNVKAGKFVASEEEKNSEDYDESQYEALNDVEKVLDKVGIKLRENYGTWKDTQDVIDEIAKKWDTWDTTTQNAVSTVVAGTRQREIFNATMNNYESVAKYEQIATNSYGTAQKKMEAYSDSITAAQKRYQAGLENFALQLERWGVIKKFYNAIGYATNHIYESITALSMIILMLKGKEIGSALTNGVIGMGIKFSNLGNSTIGGLNNIANQNAQKSPSFVSNFKNMVTNNYLQQLEQAYGTALTNGTTALNDITRQRYINLQNAIMESDLEGQNLGLMLLDQNVTEQSLTTELQKAYMNQTHLPIIEAFIGADKEIVNERAKELLKTKKVQTQEEALAKATAELAIARNNAKLNPSLGVANNIVTNNINSFRQTTGGGNPQNLTQTAIQSVLSGIGSMGGMLAGSTIAGQLSSTLFNGQGSMIASLLGGMAVSKAGASVLPQLSGLIKKVGIGALVGLEGNGLTGLIAGVKTGIGAAGLTNPVGWAVIGTTIAAAIFVGWKKKQEALIKEQAEAFQEESSKYQSMVNNNVDLKKFSELSAGVDKIGRNISLTDDEYKEFLNMNTELAKQFPSLITHTNNQGQAFVGAAEGANSLEESINSLIEQQKKLADKSLLAPELFNDTYKKAKEDYDKAKKELLLAQQRDNFSLDTYTKKTGNNNGKVSFVANNLSDYNKMLLFFKGNNIDYKLGSSTTPSVSGREKHELGRKSRRGRDQYEVKTRDIKEIELSQEVAEKLEADLSKINGITKQKIAELESNLIESKQAINEQVKAVLNLLSFEDTAIEINPNFDVKAFNELSEDAKDVISSIVYDKDLDASTGELFKKQVSEQVQRLQEFFTGTGSDTLQLYLELDGNQTIEDYDKIKSKIADSLKTLRESGEEGLKTATELSEELGFIWDENNGVYTESQTIFSKIVEQIKEARNLSEDWTFGNITEGDFNKYFTRDEGVTLSRLAQRGILTQYEDRHTLRRRLEAQNTENTDEYSARRNLTRYNRLLNDKHWSGSISSKNGGVNEFSSELEAMFDKSMEWDKFFSAEDFMASFPDLDEAMANKFEALSLAITEGGINSEQAMNEALVAIGESAQASIEKMAEIHLEEIFQGVEFDGFADSWEEFAKMAEYTANGLDKISAAQKEYDSFGRLGWKTTLDLLSANERYAEALEVVNGQVVLKANAEDILARIEIEEAIAQAKLTITNLQAELQEKANTLALLENGEMSISSAQANAEATQDNINNNEKEAKSVAGLGALYASLGKIMLAAKRGESTDIDLLSEMNKAMNNVNFNLKTETTATMTYTEADIEKLKKEVGGLIYKDDDGNIINPSQVFADGDQLYYKTLNKNGVEVMKEVGSVDTDGTGSIQHQIDLYQAEVDTLSPILAKESLTREDFYNWYDPQTIKDERDSNSGSDDFKEELLSALDALKLQGELIDKEYENWLKWNKELDLMDKNFKSASELAKSDFLESDYYKKKEENVKKLLQATQNEQDKFISLQQEGKHYNLNGEQITEKEYYETLNSYEKSIIEYKKELFNLDDEKIEDMLKINQAIGNVQESLHDLDKAYENYNDYLNSENTYLAEQRMNLEERLRLAKKDLETADSQEEYLEKEKEILEIQKEINALDYENAKLKVNILESVDASVEALIDAQKVIVATAQNTEDLIDAQNKLNDLLYEELEIRKEIAQFQIDMAERSNKYFSATAWSDPEKIRSNTQLMIDGYQKQLEDIQKQMDMAFNERFEQYSTEMKNDDKVLTSDNTWMERQDAELFQSYVNGWQEAFAKGDLEAQKAAHEGAMELRHKYGYTTDSSGSRPSQEIINQDIWDNTQSGATRRWTDNEAYNKALDSEEYRKYFEEYLETADKISEATIQMFEYMLSELDETLSDIQMTKPEDWSYYTQISEYGQEEMDILLKKQAVLKEALSDVSMWTDDQIKDFVNQAQEVQQAIKELEVNTKQEQINYQDRQFDALISYLERMREEYNDLRDDVEEYYDALLKPLEQEIDDLDKINELLELQNALKAAGEKSRVYRQGLGWVYEADHTKRKKAQQDLDNFFKQQRIDDLNDTKQAELDALDELDDGLSKYIESLKYKHEEWNRLEEERLIKQLLNASSMEEVNKKILSDYNHFINELDGNYKNYDGIFTNFLDDYKDNNAELQKLQQERLELLNPDNYIHLNDNPIMPDTTNSDEIAKSVNMTDQERAQLELAQKGWQQAIETGNQELANEWHEYAEAIRNKYGYYGGDNGSDRKWLTDEEKASLQEMVTYQGKQMSKAEAQILKHQANLAQYFSKSDTISKQYYAKELNNVFAHESNTLKEANVNQTALSNWVAYNRNSEVQYDLQNMSFNDFVNKYADDVARYQEEIEKFKKANDIVSNYEAGEKFGNVSTGIVDGNKETLVLSRDGTWMTKADADRLQYLGENWQSIPNAHEQADAIRRKYGYTTDAEGHKNSITKTDTNKWNSSQNYTSSGNTIDGYSVNPNPIYSYSNDKNNKNNNYNNITKGETGKTIQEEIDAGIRSETDLSWLGLDQYGRPLKGRANGIEGGPVTYTGLMMLHGTPSEPEYVLNNDQAYNMLYNLSRNRMPEYSSTLSGLSQGDTYTLNGDIIIDGATDPKKFWSEVTKNMSIRSNVTKNK